MREEASYNSSLNVIVMPSSIGHRRCGFSAHDSVCAERRGPEVARASKRSLNRGVELYQDEAYRAALIEFERAYEISPDYRLLYNIGGTKLQLQDFLGAARAYERYLTEGGDEVPLRVVKPSSRCCARLRAASGASP